METKWGIPHLNFYVSKSTEIFFRKVTKFQLRTEGFVQRKIKRKLVIAGKGHTYVVKQRLGTLVGYFWKLEFASQADLQCRWGCKVEIRSISIAVFSTASLSTDDMLPLYWWHLWSSVQSLRYTYNTLHISLP